MKTKYEQTLDFLFSQLPMFQRVGTVAFKKDLTNILAMCQKLGQPHQKFNSIHIAGTNGKGSVAHMLASVFTAAGLKTGLYTSPHYKDFRERIKIDGRLIPKKKVVKFIEDNSSEFNEIKPSFFEWSVALAFNYFVEEKVDIAIIETGLGGRLDSTNIVNPLLSIITNIGYDHQQFLGETLPEIAFEKAGIIKEGIPVVIGETHPETQSVFNEKAKSMSADIFFADQIYSVENIVQDDKYAHYEIKKNGKIIWDKLALAHFASYQKFNLTTLLMSLDIFHSYHPEILSNKNKAIESGLINLKKYSNYQGRWQILQRRPTVLCDSAHNEDGLKAAMLGIKEFEFNQLHIVLGMVNDKSHEKVLKLLPKEARYYFAKADIPRGLPAEELQKKAASLGLIGNKYISVRKALSAAKMAASKDDLIYVGGSIFVVAEVI